MLKAPNNLRKVKYTKKKKNKRNINNLWEKFDDEKLNESKKLEMLYSKSNLKQRDFCDLCKLDLNFSINTSISKSSLFNPGGSIQIPSDVSAIRYIIKDRNVFISPYIGSSTISISISVFKNISVISKVYANDAIIDHILSLLYRTIPFTESK